MMEVGGAHINSNGARSRQYDRRLPRQIAPGATHPIREKNHLRRCGQFPMSILLSKFLTRGGGNFNSPIDTASRTEKIVIHRNEHVPNHEVAFKYTVAMHFGQQLELNLRAILYTAHYHGWGEEIALTEEQRCRYKATEGFIDKATCGAIIMALRKVGVITANQFLKFFERACAHRNKLAHTFLSEQDFSQMTKNEEMELANSLDQMEGDLYKAMRFSRAFRQIAESHADKDEKEMRTLLGEYLDPNYDNPNRKYGTRLRKVKTK